MVKNKTAAATQKQLLLMKLTCLLLAGAILRVAAQAQESTAPLTLEKTITLEKVEGRIDHMAVDVAGQRLFVAALGNNTVEVGPARKNGHR